MTIFINILLILISLVLIVVVLMQEGNKQGLGAIGGAAETFLGKSKSKGVEGKLLLITKVAAAAFVILAIATTWFSARTFTVKYFDENGEEIFPAFENQLYVQQLLYGTTYTEEQLAEVTVEQKRATYSKGSEVYDYSTPTKEGYVGRWDKELPDVMDGKNYELHAIYEIGQFTLTVQDGHNPVDEHATEGEAHEHDVFFTETATYGEPVDLSAIQLPEAPEGYEVAWSQELPTTMPGYDTVIEVVYTEIVEEATEIEATPVEPATPAEAE
ncbi:MAG: preprotein translocase subunit SecG [Clostridia bacterium]|nr:preprotein translocase subunit SecG [Clostridia bacterium]MBQ2433087.1 preprotein translocase subunit SecG [Clostridia bacterium]MBQ5769559.1 preprotein translocase subunit SecG [Clostridia bacterium]